MYRLLRSTYVYDDWEDVIKAFRPFIAKHRLNIVAVSYPVYRVEGDVMYGAHVKFVSRKVAKELKQEFKGVFNGKEK